MKNTYYIIALVFFGIILYLLTIKGSIGNPEAKLIHGQMDRPTQAFELSPERGRFALVMSLAENSSFALSEDLMKTAYPDVGYWQGRFYTFFAPGISMLAVPFYLLGKAFNLSQLFVFSAVSIFAIANLIFIFKISQKVLKIPPWAAFLAALIFGFGSTSWSYAGTLYQHHVTAYLLLSSFYWAYLFRQTGKKGWFWVSLVWLNYGWALLIDYPNLFLFLPVVLYLLASSFSIKSVDKHLEINVKSVVLVTSVLFLALNFAHAYYNYVNFGDWKRLSGSLVGYKEILTANQIKPTGVGLDLSVEPNLKAETIKELEDHKNVGHFFKEQSLPFGLFTLTLASDKGLLFFSPIFVMSFFGIFLALRRLNAEIITLLGIVGVDLILYGSWDDPWGGWAFGPRYLIPAMAILTTFIGVAFAAIENFWLGRLLPFLNLSYSVGVALLGVLTTNAIPPKVEAEFLHSKFGYYLNWDYFLDNKSSSFFYNEFFKSYLTLPQYFLLIYTLLIIVFTICIFWLPTSKQDLAIEVKVNSDLRQKEKS